MAQLSLAVDEEVGRIGVQTGFITDIGGGRENQDDGFIWSNSDAQLVVIGVLDGHGREVGRTAAVAAKNCLLKLLESDYSKLLQSPVDFLIYAHQRAHESIKQSFAAEFERQGYQVQAAGEGFLLKRRTPMDNWSCVHGGAACTLIALVGSSLYIANVGDSTALLCAPKPILSPSTLQFERDAAIDDPSAAVQSLQSRQEASRLLVLTAEHSPESTSEFVRLRTYRHRDGDPSQPALYVVYDSASHDKTQCAPIFDVTKPSLAASQRGSYFKNVRKEWASVVSTPSSAAFQDALAFTRSLGDLHLHTYGVTHLPEVHRVDLLPLFMELQALAAANPLPETADSVARRTDQTLCVVAATDGVWDNWLYEDVAKFVTDSSCLRAANATAEGAQRVAASFMHRNAVYAKRNFGSQADNATGIVMYISASRGFPMM